MLFVPERTELIGQLWHEIGTKGRSTGARGLSDEQREYSDTGDND